MKRGPRDLLERLLDLVFPKRCVQCGAAGAWLCQRCLERLRPVEDGCPCCGRPAARPADRCPECRDRDLGLRQRPGRVRVRGAREESGHGLQVQVSSFARARDGGAGRAALPRGSASAGPLAGWRRRRPAGDVRPGRPWPAAGTRLQPGRAAGEGACRARRAAVRAGLGANPARRAPVHVARRAAAPRTSRAPSPCGPRRCRLCVS